MIDKGWHLCTVSQTARTFTDQQEIDCLRLHEERRGRGRVGADERRSVVQIQLTGTRDVEMARGLVGVWMKRKRVEVKTWVRRSRKSGTTELVRNVRVEELRRELREEIDGVSL